MDLRPSGFVPAIRYMRTATERRDQRLSWDLPDHAFFASGACHVLAFRALRRQSIQQWRVVLIRPTDGLPGTHACATDGLWAFDFNGWVPEADLLAGTTAECRDRWPTWGHERITIGADVDLDDFCRLWGHRPPIDFVGDVETRADRYLERFLPVPPSREKCL